MALMNNIRSNTHVVLWILILAFVGLIVFEWGASFSFSGAGGGQPKNIAVINGEKISPQQYFQILQSEYDRMRQQTDGTLTDQQRQQIQDQLWEQLVNETLIQQAVEERDIMVTNQDILRELRNNPPEFLRQVEAFQTDGQFDKQKYLQALNNPAGNEWLTVENYIRASLPAKKLQSTVMASVTVHESEIRAEYRRNNIEYTVDYVHVPVSAVSDEEAQPSTQAIQNYYQNHIDEYRVPEQRTLQYVEFPKTPSQADSAAARDLATEALQRARSGEDFAELAREYSDGPSASEGGDLGWFGRGQMVPAFEEAAFDTPTGEVAGPVLSQFGYHVIHVRNRRTRDGEEQILASHILINIEVSPATIDNLNSQANLFLFDAQDYSFQSSADTHNVTIRETQPFGRDASFIPGLDPAGEATDFAFSNPVGTISDVIDVESGYYIFRLQNIREPYVRDLESVRSQISRQLITEKKRDLAFQQAQELRASLSDSSDLQQLTATGSLLTYSAPDPFTIAGTIPGVGQVPEFKGAVKALDVGQTSPAVKSDQGAYIIRLKDKTAFNQERYKQQRAQIRQRLLTRKQNRFMTRWLESLRTEANIVDNRDAFL